MVQRRTVDLLPEIFRTETNRQFLAATLDQLTAEPNLKRTQGYVGRRVGPGVNPADNYVTEPTPVRADYQLEPAVTFFEPETKRALDAITYPGMIDALDLLNANTTRQDRLWESQYYTWDPFCDLDKFVNYSQYYWLPAGPDSVDVFTGTVPLTDAWEVTRGLDAYTFSDVAGENPTLTLVRGGNYTFTVNQTGTPFYIQAAPGISGLMPGTNNISSRTVMGVLNNGEDNGTVTFDVPFKDAQSFYTNMPYTGQAAGKPTGTVDLVTNLRFVDINNVYVNTFLAANPTGIDGIRGLDGLTVAFLSTNPDPESGGWQQTTQFDPLSQMTLSPPVGTRAGSRAIASAQVDSPSAVTFFFPAVSSTAPFTPGCQIQVTGATPASFNGIWSVTACDSLSVTVEAVDITDTYVGGGSLTGLGQWQDLTTEASGVGSNALLSVTLPLGTGTYADLGTVITVASPGTGYAVGDVITIRGDQLGGTTPTNDLTLIITGVSENGAIGSFDTQTYDQTTVLSNEERYSIWLIQYQYDNDGNAIMQLTPVLSVAELTKFRVLFGDQGANTAWYKNASGYFEQIPLLTAALDTLYYQDATNPALYGRIQLVDQAEFTPIRIDDIIGAQTYTSPNGVTFTNGLKVQFRGTTDPSNYSNLEYYVEGVGTGLGIDARVGFIDGEAYFGPWHYYQGQKLTGSEHSETVFQQYIYDTVAESLANQDSGYPVGAPLPNEPQPGATLGNGIRLLPVTNFVTPETYTKSASVPFDSLPYDVGNYDATLNAPLVPDYLTVNRASRDLNAWTRSNRWFHSDVIQATADYNNQIAVFDNTTRAKRPIIEFRADMRLWNTGTQGKTPVNVIDFTQTNTLLNVNGSTYYTTDGYALVTGSRVIFAADQDPEVRNRIYEVQFIDPDGLTSTEPVIDLVPVAFGEALVDQQVVVLSGNTLQGLSYRFDGVDWIRSQQKTGVNQAPLWDVFDSQGRSLGDREAYPSTTFEGSRLFGYAIGGTSTTDSVLGFALRYLNINNVGDIVFDNYFYNDTFLYVENSVSVTENISIGLARQYIDRTLFSDLIGWQTAAQENRSRQVFRFIYDGEPLVLDVPIDQTSVFAPLQIFQGTEFIDPNRYTVTLPGDGSTVITLTDSPLIGEVIEVQAISDVASEVAFYQVPLNLENNPLNEDATAFTLGTIRTHYQSIGQNLRTLQGPIDGANNTRDLGDILRYGDNIVQHSSPLVLAGSFLRRRQYEAIASLAFNSTEYQKFKARLIDLATRGDYINNTPTQVLDSALTEISASRSDIAAFYWSDMLPHGGNYTTATYTYSVISTPTFSTQQTYNFTESNYQALSVYLNGTLLQRGPDYVVSEQEANFTITVALAVGDEIVVREYSATYGSYVPNTPTKMGLYSAYRPEIYLDETYVTPTLCIRGHDGSVTVAYGDYRDNVLLEFETRIFNNIKIVTPIPLTLDEVLPGQFRETEYTLGEINTILAPDFLGWVGWNKLDYTEQTYLGDDGFTWNYSQSANKLSGDPLPGGWRGIYNYFYDTIYPNTRPWEMLGFSEEPTWWQDYYGPAPYTSGNTVLWQDLSQGLVRDPAGEYVRPEYVRPDLLSVIPADSEGALIPPIDSTVGNYDRTSFRRSWTFGDDGPVENAWRTSSAWPFAVMRLLLLTKPAKFFGLFADRDRYVYNTVLGQYLWNQRYRLDSANLAPLYGDGTSRASYINWVIDYNRQLGVNSTDILADFLTNTDVRLAWRVAGFTDKRLMKIYTERSTPNSQNESLLLPDESYQILLYKNQPFQQTAFSSIIVQTTTDGWQVYGYSAFTPYFEILASIPNGNTLPIEAGGAQARVAIDHSNDVVQVPYGYTFTNRTAVCDFIYSYGLLLTEQGFVFDTLENGYTMDWLQMCREFLYWSNQGWAPNSIINLNPGATRVSVTQPGTVVDSLVDLRPENLILNQNRQPLPSSELVIERLDNTFSAQVLSTNTINYLNVNLTAYEHLVVLDNVSIFADLIYQPVTGARQSRVLVSGWISGDWNGTVNAPGFVLNQTDSIAEWVANRKYTKGQIVKFKNEYWAASTIIEPSQEFDYTLWLKSDYDEIMQGLLPNAANASDQLAQAYSVFSTNLENEVDLFSYGLIGFRPRQYMQALNISDTSQVQLYQQFLGSKGTLRSAEIFSYADLGKETAQYDIYEYWAINRAEYGATANRNYIEFRLKQQNLLSDPSLIQVIEPSQTSEADQTVLISEIWKSSDIITSPDFLPTITAPIADAVLPTAGYVNLDDVNFSVMELGDITDQELIVSGTGTTVWVAKVNNYDWNVYRLEALTTTVISVSDNLDGRALVQFRGQHDLVAGDWLIIKEFNDLVNGAYRVQSVPNLTSLIIDLVITGEQTTLTGIGIAFTLVTARVAQASDVANLSYTSDLIPGARVWVDDDGTGHWVVLEKTEVFSPETESTFTPETPQAQNRYGASLSQGFYNLAAMVGAPGYLTGASDSTLGPGGGVYLYSKSSQFDNYEFNFIQTLATPETQGYGSTMDMGDQTWAAIGAPASDADRGYVVMVYNPPTSTAFLQTQILIGNPGDEFGASVAVSNNERWLYVGAPGNDSVHVYARIEVETQQVSYVTTGLTATFNYDLSIVVNPALAATQLVVVLNNQELTAGVDYTTGTGSVFLTTIPLAGQYLVITRRNNLTRIGDNTTDTFATTSVYTLANVYTEPDSVTVLVNDVLQRPTIDYSITVSGQVRFTSPPDLGDAIRIVSGTYFRRVTIIDGTVLSTPAQAGSRFGASVATTTDGGLLAVGAPLQDVTVQGASYAGAGQIFMIARSEQNQQVTVDSQQIYGSRRQLIAANAPIAVQINGQYLTPDNGFNINPQYSVDYATEDVIIDDGLLSVGDVVTIENNYFDLLQVVTAGQPNAGAQFGASADQCINNCSVYVGAPRDSSILPQAGRVEFWQNVPRVFGTVTSPVVNPDLSAITGQYVSINGYLVALTNPATHDSNDTYVAGDLVQVSSSLYRARTTVPATTEITNSAYWQPVNWSRVMAQDIVTAAVPNATASVTADKEFIGDGTTQQFDIGTLYSASGTYTTLVFVNNIRRAQGADYTYDNSTGMINFVSAPAASAQILVVGSQLVVSVINAASAVPLDKLEILPGSNALGTTAGILFQSLGLDTASYAYIQGLTSPVPQDYAYFGHSVFISDRTTDLVIGAPNATPIQPTTFDNGTTYFDARSTAFFNSVPNSGAVYTFDYLASSTGTLTDPGHFVFGQQIYDQQVASGDLFGQAADYTTGVLLVGSPGTNATIEDDSTVLPDAGDVHEFQNLSQSPAWTTIRRQSPVVDINLMNTVFMYDRVSNTTKQYFDFFDPLQGKLLGVVRQNIDFIGAVDPAAYNVGTINNYGQRWAQDRVGEIWWDTNNCRFIDPNQDDIVYASRRWGQTFPGSTVDVYQWVASTVPPAQYTGSGTVRDVLSYSVTSAINEQGLFETTYYYWVRNVRQVNRAARKTISAETVSRYIENPRASGIAYIAPINGSTISIYNGLSYISAEDTILHVEYDQELNDDAVHTQFALIPQDRADGFLDALLYRKLQDSFCGVDTAGNQVPNPFSPVSEKYGTAFRPRQSMFVNRFLALQNYLVQANAVMATLPITEIRESPLLSSEESRPPSQVTVNNVSVTIWNAEVANYTELTYQDLNQVSLGYLYLVDIDETNDDLWTIYEVAAGILPGSRVLNLVRVQSYNTRLYWDYVNWYAPGFSGLDPVVAEVANRADLDTLTVPVGSSVKVTNAVRGKYEIYRLDTTGWTRVALEDGTVAIKTEIWDYSVGRFGFDSEVFDAQYFDQEPVIETRKIIQALNDEILIEDLAIERNRLLILMFNYILSEQEAPLWLTKTSLIDVNHTVRQLLPFQIYRADNQDFVLNYIQEVKPYHTQIREFNLLYQGSDVYQGTVTDFDVPAYWNTSQGLFISPVLDDNANVPLSTTSSVSSTDPIWQTLPWSQWYNNYLLTFESITVLQGGTGYTDPPQVQIGESWQPSTAYAQGQQFYYDGLLYTVQQPGITGIVAPTFDSGTRLNGTALLAYAGQQAQATATVTSAGVVIEITLTNPGSGYLVTPMIALVGGNGTGARATAVLANPLVRSVSTTIKYDRYQYSSDITDWTANVSYAQGTQVRYAEQVWEADSTVSSAEFDPDDWTIVPAGDLSGVDRTQGYYDPTVNMPGRDLALLMTGIDYPGVQVDAPDFDANAGYDVGNFDIYPFDNLITGPEGLPTYDPSILDAIYESSFTDIYLGTRVTDINVDGGQFVDTYSSHAPEELIPGAIFDTLDLRVYATPGSDWALDGHGWPESSITLIWQGAPLGWSGLLDTVFVLQVYNQTSGQHLRPGIDYTTAWADQTVTMIQSVGLGDAIVIQALGLGGGSQIYINDFPGEDSRVIIADVDYNLINSMVIFQDGQLTQDYIYEPRYEITGVTTGFSSVEGTVLNVSSTAGVVQGSLIVNPGYTAGQTVLDVISATQVVTSAPPTATPTGQITFLPYTWTTKITFGTAISTQSRVAVAALGTGDPVTYSWSLPVTQAYTAGNVLTFPLSVAQTQGTNPVNLIVDVNGIRARPAEGVEYISDGSTVTYTLPLRGGYLTGGYNLGNVVTGNVSVYINNDPLPNTDWVLDTYVANSETRSITLDSAAGNDAVVLISVDYAADYVVSGPALIWKTSDPNVSGPSITVVPSPGDTVSITTFNDTSQQNLLTQVFQGPTTDGVLVGEGFDFGTANAASGSFDFAGVYGNTGSNVTVGAARLCEDIVYTIITTGNTDFTQYGSASNVPLTVFTANVTATGNIAVFGTGTVSTYLTDRSAASDAFNFESNSFDYSNTVPTETNRFDTGRAILDASRLTVTLDSRYLFDSVDYSVQGSNVILGGAVINQSQVVTITSPTQSVVPGAEAFRIFQDMRGQQLAYRITTATTTALTQDLTSTADVIHVEDAGNLSEPNLVQGILGQITIGGERILYRVRDTMTNTLSGLRRGTAGTGAADHVVGTAVYDIGVGNLIPEEGQNYLDTATFLSNGVTALYTAPNLILAYDAIEPYDSTPFDEADINGAPGSYAYGETAPAQYLEIYVGGALATTGYTVITYDPVSVVFTTVPPAGVEIEFVIRRGHIWYVYGLDIPLQETDTRTARFIRGE
jgi:hypothetical protein